MGRGWLFQKGASPGKGSGKGWLAGRGGCKGFGCGGVGGRGTGPRDGANFAMCVVFLLFLTRTKRRKMAFFEGCPVGWGGTHRSCLVDGGVDQGPWLQERVGGGVGAMAVAKKGEGWGLVGCSKKEQVQGRGQGRVGLAVGGGARASVAGVSGRDTGPRDGANFATCVVFLFVSNAYEGCPVGWRGGTHRSWPGGRGG